MVNVVSPDEAFAYISSVAAIGIIVVWGSILLCHLRYRALVARGERPASDYRLPGAPVVNVAALCVLGLVVVLLAFTSVGRDSLLTGAVWFGLLTAAYVLLLRRRSSA